MVLSLEQTKTNQAAKIKKLKKRVKKLKKRQKKRTYGLERLVKVSLSARIESSIDEEGLGAQEDASKHGRIAEIDVTEDLFLIDKTAQDYGRINDQDMFRVHDLDGDEVFLDVTTSENVEQDATVAESVEVDADRQLAEQIQAHERDQLSIKERSKLLDELIESRRKYFTAKRAKEIRNKPPTKAQQKNLMCTYMKNMEGFKKKDFKGKSFDDIKKCLTKFTKNVEESRKKNQAEVSEGSSKREGEELEQESAKKQKLVEQVQDEVYDTTELKKCLEMVPKDDDLAIKATPISSRSSTIVYYKIYREWKKSYFKIIRADGNSQNYLTFGTMFKNFNK
nr:hypothetical protein [Tanacetum cinerariifolium]